MGAGPTDSLFDTLQRTAVPSVFSMKARLGRLLANPKLPILRRLARHEMAEFATLQEHLPVIRYDAARNHWQLRALRAEHFGEPAPTVPPPRENPR
jgi:hypothetical protein